MHSSRPRNSGGLKFSIRVTVVGIFLVVTLLTASVAIGLQYYFSTRMATESTLELYREAATSTSDYLSMVDKRAVESARMLAAYPGLINHGKVNSQAREVFAETLRNNPIFYAIYIGQDNGDFYELINLDVSTEVRNQLEALPQDRWMLLTVSGEGKQRQQEFHYYDKNFTLRTSRRDITDYQPTSRPWYINAQRGLVHKTDPYLFQSLQAPGATYSTMVEGEEAVLAVDIALASLTNKIGKYSLGGDNRIFIYHKSGEIIASSEASHPSVTLPVSVPLELNEEQRQIVTDNRMLKVSNELDWPPFDFVVSGQPYGYSIDVLKMIGEMTGFEFRYINGHSRPELKSMFQQGQLDIMHTILATEANTALGELSEPIVHVPFGILMRKGERAVSSIHQLEGKRVAIPRDWSIIETIKAEVPSATILESDNVKEMFKAVSDGRVDAGIDTAAFLKYTARKFFLSDVKVHAPFDFGGVKVTKGLHYLVHPSRKNIVPIINLALANITSEQRQALEAKWLIDSKTAHKRTSTVPYAELVTLAEDSSGPGKLHRLLLEGEEYFVYIKSLDVETLSEEYFAVVAPVSLVLAPAVEKVKTALLITAASFIALLPLVMWLASMIVRPVKQLALENEKIQKLRYRELQPVESRIAEIDELASSLIVMSHAIEKHAKEQEALMEAFIQLIAQAIDDKSPYTAGHCARVPELAMMLANEAERSNDIPFKEFRFEDETARREFRIGAWLHDCGKITTPEYIVNKGTKLETIYNRIHEVRTRFEVLWRDAEIDFWKKFHESPEDKAHLHKALLERQQHLQQAFVFVAECNKGVECMDEADMEKLERIAEETWSRHFDDTLGLSIQEQRCTQHIKDVALPATEKLLSDKPCHLVERSQHDDYNEKLDINVPVPKHLYNFGELYNLKIKRGTLTDEDRFKINEHIISTIKMLDNLPLPKELKRVPRYASTHHERVDGQGYPRGLTADDLSIPERIMVIADIFEALTAADRPYKAAKPISVAIDILHTMVEDNHIDQEVFELFLKSGTYLDYAKRFLAPEQIDTVDISRYLK